MAWGWGLAAGPVVCQIDRMNNKMNVSDMVLGRSWNWLPICRFVKGRLALVDSEGMVSSVAELEDCEGGAFIGEQAVIFISFQKWKSPIG